MYPPPLVAHVTQRAEAAPIDVETKTKARIDKIGEARQSDFRANGNGSHDNGRNYGGEERILEKGRRIHRKMSVRSTRKYGALLRRIHSP